MAPVVYLAIIGFGFNSIAANYLSNSQKCFGFPRIASVKTASDVCMGLVVDKSKINWRVPRKVLANGNVLYITDMGGWTKGRGAVHEITLANGKVVSQRTLFSRLNRTHGIAMGPDGWVYFGDADRIYKFDPNLQNPQKITVIARLPFGYKPKRGSAFESSHPLSEFLFLQSGDLIVNVGAPSNDCSKEHRRTGSCAQRDLQGHLRRFKYDRTDNTFDSKFTILAKGLRNSMALIENPNTDELYQAENSADKKGTPDEFNVIDIKSSRIADYGWPFCIGFAKRFTGYRQYKSFCANTAVSPLFLIPAHAAPLDMTYYDGVMFPELQNKILMSWHGHRPIGSRIAVYPTDSVGRPNVDRNTSPLKTSEFLIDGWQKDSHGRHPKGRPVGIGIGSQGEIYVVDDKNASLLVIAKTNQLASGGGGGSGFNYTEFNLEQKLTSQNIRQWKEVFKKTLIPLSCQNCHSNIIQKGHPRRSLAAMLNNGWIDLMEGPADQRLWLRLVAPGGEKIMPPSPANNIYDLQGSRVHVGRIKKWLEGL